ncbi:MAG TPA: hypothetical protein VM283_06895, partial [Armatimonadota bacterium]|nr:hypothetical protein [Armatimonadota bacterium]
MLAGYDPRRYRSLGLLFSVDVGVGALNWLAWILQTMGYPDLALQRSQEALALAREVNDVPSLCFALAFARANLHVLRREWQVAQVQIEDLERLVAQNDLPLFKAWSGFLQGLVQVAQASADPEEGLAQMRRCWSAWQDAGIRMGGPFLVILLVEAYGQAGNPGQGLRLLEEGFAAIDSGGMRYYEAEMHRLRGSLLLMREGVPVPPAVR